MTDAFILACLSNGLTIGGGVYFVAWDCALSRAVIAVQLGFGDNGETLPLKDLLDEDGKRLTFHSELAAHAFLLELQDEATT